ncbi:hypothetical protein EVAR_59648_1 [Eumeta japonica]|uniref:Uncharacterized protein n=1 Tax=Eumeta variegata TaxID=151549 RepID=A0A4C1YHI4_EUMVA|nr:hypothetical protein EVAR_59648_1 [Eumeta japonica]
MERLISSMSTIINTHNPVRSDEPETTIIGYLHGDLMEEKCMYIIMCETLKIMRTRADGMDHASPITVVRGRRSPSANCASQQSLSFQIDDSS